MIPFRSCRSGTSLHSLLLVALLQPLCAAADPALLTKENYDRIQNGQTTEEAKAILGKPSGGQGTAKDWTSHWDTPDRKYKIEIHFKDKIVDRKSTTFEWGKADPVAAPAKEGPAGKANANLSKEADPKLAPYLRQLRSPDEKERDKAFKSLVRMKYDEDLAEEVSKIMLTRLRDKEESQRMTAQEGMRKWVTPAHSDYFLKELAHKPKTNSPNDPDRDRLTFAVEMLVKLKEPRAVPALCEMLDWHLFDRSTAESALIKLGPELGQAEVLKYSNDKSAIVQRSVAKILSEYKTGSGDLLSRHLNDLQAAEPEMRYAAIEKIARLDVVAERRAEVAAALEKMLDDHPGALNDDIQRAEEKARKAGQKGLTNFIQETRKHPANLALATLAKWGTTKNEPAVRAILEHKISEMREGAAITLKSIGTQQSIPALKKAAEQEKFKTINRLCQEAIDEIKKRGT